MGIYHFAGLGRSPGAVTAGLSYIRDKYGVSHSQYGNMAEGLVIFTSPEVASGDTTAYAGTAHNSYGTRNMRKTWPSKFETHTIYLVREFMRREFPETALYLVQTDVNNYDRCLAQVARSLLKFHAPADVGKHIWINITGGSNLLNAGLFQAAYLSGVVARLYYTFVANVGQDGRYLQPFSLNQSEFRYGEIVPIKMRFGPRHLRVLETLKTLTADKPDEHVDSQMLLSLLKETYASFVDMDKGDFLRNFLNVMPGIEQRGNRQEGQDDAIRLSEEGQNILTLTQQPLFRALVLREQPDETEMAQLLADLAIERLN